MYVVNGKDISADSLVRLLKNDASQANYEGWKAFAEQAGNALEHAPKSDEKQLDHGEDSSGGGHGTISIVDDGRHDLGKPRKSSGKKLMLSGRFDAGTKERVLREVGNRLEALGETVLVVSASAGQSFGPMTMEYLQECDVMVS